MVTRVFIVSILPANDDEFVTAVELTVDMDAANEELFKFIELCNPVITVAAEELLLVTVPDKFIMEELSDPDAL